MNSELATRRFRILVTLALVAALALGSFWVLEVIRRSASDYIPNVTRTEPDYYVDEFSYVKMTDAGTQKYYVAGDRLTHNPADDTYDVVHPLLKSFSPGKPVTTIHAERAHVNSDGSEMRLYDNVRLDRAATTSAGALQVQSEYMLVLPDDEIAKTDEPVTITVGQSVLKGKGMFVNNATRELKLASRVQGTYIAPVH
jgi:lipopolysaccharide export system protein LptC